MIAQAFQVARSTSVQSIRGGRALDGQSGSAVIVISMALVLRCRSRPNATQVYSHPIGEFRSPFLHRCD
jgi:hypothetical protein